MRWPWGNDWQPFDLGRFRKTSAQYAAHWTPQVWCPIGTNAPSQGTNPVLHLRCRIGIHELA
jgi:hypothetical protein